MALHPDCTSYPCGSLERPILDTYRASVQAAMGRNGCALRVDGLPVSTIRAIIRDRMWLPGLDKVADPAFAPIVVTHAAAEQVYEAAALELIENAGKRPGARPMHT